MNKQIVYTITTGNINPFMSRSRAVVDFIKQQEGFIGVHPHYPDGTLWVFDTLNNAKIARNRIKGQGGIAGKNIMEAELINDTLILKGKAE